MEIELCYGAFLHCRGVKPPVRQAAKGRLTYYVGAMKMRKVDIQTGAGAGGDSESDVVLLSRQDKYENTTKENLSPFRVVAILL